MKESLRIGVLLLICAGPLASVASTQDHNQRNTPMVEMLQKVRPSVVAIFSQLPNKQWTSGSGSIIHPSGYVLTNDHVVVDRPGLVLLENQTPIQYRLVGRMPELDLAIVKIPTDSDLPTIELGRSHDLKMGETIANIGNPGGRGIVATSGIISSPSLRLGNALALSQLPLDDANRMIQFDAASNGGNSGGPLVNLIGQQIGVVQSMVGAEENSNLAIPIDRVRQNLRRIVAADIFRLLDVGLEVDALAEQPRVVVVRDQSPAASADIRVGDVITKVGPRQLSSPTDWILSVNDMQIGKPVELAIARQGETITLPLTPKKTQPLPALDALKASDLEPKLRCRGFYTDKSNTHPLQSPSDGEPDFEALVEVPVAAPDGLEREDFYILNYEGYLKAEETGPYRMSIGSDDGSRLFLHGELLIDNDGNHPEEFRGSWCLLQKGWHPIRLEFFEYSGKVSLTMKIQKKGREAKSVTADSLAHLPIDPVDDDAPPPNQVDKSDDLSE